MDHFITRRALFVTAAASAALALALPRAVLAAATHDVQMLNAHPENKRLRQVFLPRVLVAEPGDTVRFVAADKGHNSAATEGMLPDGAVEWGGKINEEVAVTLEQPGFYGYQCTPHYAAGMVGLIIVKGAGMMDNLEAAKAVGHRGKAKAVWGDIWAEVEGMDLSA
ncbi:pseudoazurin [Antarctobacter jejuensis]|uniref:pseudoazurin n=1 Tax=Antarctobacter jejuensis TaxID=1439938 RepID=UPI003FD699FB